MHPIRIVIASALAAGAAAAQVIAQTPLAGNAIPQFIEPLPLLSVQGGPIVALVPQTDPVTGAPLNPQQRTLSMCEFQTHVLPRGTFAPGVAPATWTFGYVEGSTCPTTVQETYLGPALVNLRGVPTEIRFANRLGSAATTNVLAWKNAADQTLHWADPLNGGANACAMAGGIPAPGSACARTYAGPIPAAPHVHGGEVPAELDGGPDSWFTSDALIRGAGYYSKAGAAGNEAIYTYPNSQQAAPIWFHDHAVGVTRLNVYAGLAGGYYIVDPQQQLPPNFPGVAEVVPIILQDRMFDTNGQLFFPSDSLGGVLAATNPQHPYWVPEFVGDVIVVNGKAWPYFTAQPRRYRFLFLNGSNARTYELFFVNPVTKAMGPPIWIIGNDDGYLNAPVKLDPNAGGKLVIMPGERYEAIIDFAGLPAGTTLLLRNTAKTPYPAGGAPNGQTTGRVIQVRIAGCPGGAATCDTSWNPATPGATIVQQPRLTNAGTLAVVPDKTRQLTLNEVLAPPSTAIDPVTGVLTAYPGGPLEILVNNTKWTGVSARPYGDFVQIGEKIYSELPQEGDTEVWEIVNLTADAHPMHTHLASFQLINRQAYNTTKYNAKYAAAFPASPGCLVGTYCPGFGPPLDYNTGNARALGGNPDIVPFLQGAILPPGLHETGWKDTVMVPPGQVTRIAVRWAPNDLPVTTQKKYLTYPFDPSGNLGYVWHCHIIDHEDNEMMRPDLVQLNPLGPAPAARPFQKGIQY